MFFANRHNHIVQPAIRMTDIDGDMFGIVMHVAIGKPNPPTSRHQFFILRWVEQLGHRHDPQRFVIMLTVYAAQHKGVIPGQPLPVVQVGKMIVRQRDIPPLQ